MGDYVSDMAQQAKIQTDPPVGAPRQMGEISLLRGFKFSPFLPQNTSKMGVNRHFQAQRSKY